MPRNLAAPAESDRRGRWLLPAVLFAIGLAATARAEVEYQLTNWRTEQGLPSNKVMAVAQATDGYMWIGTYDGLARFDGERFRRYDSTNVPGWRDSSVTALHAAPGGEVWIGHVNGAISSYRDGHFTEHALPAGWPGSKVENIQSDQTGAIWAQDDMGNVLRVRDGKLFTPEPGQAPGVYAMAGSRDGLWLINAGRLFCLQGERIEPVVPPPGMNDYVHGLCAGREGGFWVLADHILWKWASGTWTEFGPEVASGGAPVFTMLETRDGQIVGGTTDHGMVIIDPGKRERDRQLWRRTGFASDWVLSMCEDHEGGLWIATGTAGVFRRREKNVVSLVPPDEWQGRLVLSVAPARAGGLWVGTEGAGLYRWREGVWTNFAKGAGIRNPYLWSLAEGSDDRLWLGTWRGSLYVGTGDQFTRAPGVESLAAPVRSVQLAKDGGVWLGTTLGVMRYQNGKGEWLEPSPERRVRDVCALLEDPDGTLWAGTDGAGLARFRGGELTRFRRRNGLGSDFIACLFRDSAGVLWVGTRSGGISRFEAEAFSTVGVGNGLPDASIFWIEEDGLGFIWMNSRSGIFRVARAELMACAEGRVSQITSVGYGLSDGLLTLAASSGQPGGCKLPDGRLVFATDRGLALVDPKGAKPNLQPPPVVIESFRVGDQTLAEDAFPSATIVVPAGAHRVEIKYTGLSYVDPEKVRFRHQLEGLEAGWTFAGTERSAVYNYVPPGRYVFRVTAANNDGRWNAQGRSLRFEILPYFWQTMWFKALVIAGVGLVTGGIVWTQGRRRMQRELAALERERAIQTERTRIANDMHDDLGAHLTRITMLSETARAEIADRTAVESRLGQIYETARSITRALDEIVWAVNPKHDTLESLVAYFEKFAFDLLGAAGLRCRLELPSEFSNWHPGSEVRHNLFLAYKEALNNAVRHSGANTVTVAMQLDATGCTLVVADNGHGLQSAPGTRNRAGSGNGLASMNRRLERITGRCLVQAGMDGGVVVSLFVPCHAPGCSGETATASATVV